MRPGDPLVGRRASLLSGPLDRIAEEGVSFTVYYGVQSCTAEGGDLVAA